MMRSTVRSVGAEPGFGCFWMNLSMTAAFAHAASDRLPSIVGASVTSMRTAAIEGRANALAAGPGSWASAMPLKQYKRYNRAAGEAYLRVKRKNTFPPG